MKKRHSLKKTKTKTKNCEYSKVKTDAELKESQFRKKGS